MAINIFFSPAGEPPLFSIGTKEDSAVSRHPVRNLTLCKQPEEKRKKEKERAERERTLTAGRNSLGTKKSVSRCSSCPLYLGVKKRGKKHDVPYNRCATYGLKKL